MTNPESTPNPEPAADEADEQDGVPQRTAGENDVCVVCEERIRRGTPLALVPYGPGDERGGPVHLNDRCEHQRRHVS